MRAAGRPLFLDLKLHDIPNTVAGAIRSVVVLEPHYLTMHAAGGIAMMKAAREAAEEEAARRGVAPPNLLGVTVLTSLDADALARQGIASSAHDQVLRLAALAHEAGLAGVIASPHEVATLRAAHGPDFHIVVPGIRPASGAWQRQGRSSAGCERRPIRHAPARRRWSWAAQSRRRPIRSPQPAPSRRS